MTVRIIAPQQLSAAQIDRWRQLQDSRRTLASPFFSVEFCQLVAGVRDDLRIVVFIDGGEAVGFLPLHRKRFGTAAPLAGQISDYHGIVGTADRGRTAATMLSAAGLASYDFNHLPRDQALFAGGAFARSASPLIDLRDGFVAWLRDRRAHTSAIRTVERRRRKLERDLGPLRFAANDPSDAAWEALRAWKRAALADRHTRCVLDTPWVAELVNRLRQTDSPRFGGMLSTLRAGDRLVAVHFGMRSARAWHWWFPSYDPGCGRYSPGLVLLHDCARRAADMGLAELDLGRGTQRYKREFANAARPLCEGSVERGASAVGALRRLRKVVQRAGELALPDALADFNRRALNRLLGAGLLS